MHFLENSLNYKSLPFKARVNKKCEKKEEYEYILYEGIITG